QDMPALPSMPSTATELQGRITGILAKLDRLPYEALGADASRALANLNATLLDTSNALKRVDADVTPGLKTTLDDVRGLVATAHGVLKNELNTTLTGVNTTLTGVNTALEDLRRPLATADALLKNTDATLLGKNAPIQQELHDALQEITQTLRSLRVLMDYLDRHPEALIRGKTEVKP